MVRHFLTGDDADADIAQHRLADRLAAADLQQRGRRHPGRGEHRLAELAGGRAGLALQQAAAGQGAQRHAGLRRQRVLAVHRQHQRVAAQLQAGQACVVEQLRGGGEVDAVLLQRLDHLLRVADLHRHGDLPMALAERLDQVEHVIGRGGADAQAALQLAGVAQVEVDVGLALQQFLDQRQQAHALLAEAQATATAVEQLDAVLALQVADLRGHRRLAEAELLRRLGHAAQAGNRIEGLQLGQHRFTPPPAP
ncbi:hypothetical protein FQZ97_879720 [compost metagenome]